MRIPVIAGNWKMHKTLAESWDLAAAVAGLVAGAEEVEVVLGPPFPALATVAEAVSGSGIGIAAQNVFWEAEGAFTGEVSAPMLTAVGCTHVIIGHSERRQLFGETDEMVNRRLQASLAVDLTPIVCIGETLAQREAGQTLDIVAAQVRGALAGLSAADIGRCLIAYEPVWAIGTGRTATPAQAEEVHAAIRMMLGELADAAVGAGVRILYGGSVKPGNIDELMRMTDIDGALVGGASLDAASFARIVRFER